MAVAVAAITAGQAVGTATAGRSPRRRTAALSRMVVASATATAGGALLAGAALPVVSAAHAGPAPVVVGIVLLTAGFGLAHHVVVVLEGRLQEAVQGPARATVMSVAGLATDMTAIAVYAVIALGSRALPLSWCVAALGIPMIVAAGLLGRHRQRPGGTAGRGESCG